MIDLTNVELNAGELLIVNNNNPFPANGKPNGFYNTTSLNNIDPTKVEFVYSVNGGPQTKLTYGVQTNVFRTGVGLYYVSIDSTGLMGDWQVAWFGDPDGTVPQIAQAVEWARFTVSRVGNPSLVP